MEVDRVSLSYRYLGVRGRVARVGPKSDAYLGVVFRPSSVKGFRERVLLCNGFSSSPGLLAVAKRCFWWGGAVLLWVVF